LFTSITILHVIIMAQCQETYANNDTRTQLFRARIMDSAQLTCFDSNLWSDAPQYKKPRLETIQADSTVLETIHMTAVKSIIQVTASNANLAMSVLAKKEKSLIADLYARKEALASINSVLQTHFYGNPEGLSMFLTTILCGQNVTTSHD
jgi:hypothetical protein